MKNVSTGFGLCVLGLGIAAWPVLDRLMPQANAVGIGTTAVTAVAAAATAQGDPPAPTVVWMGVSEYGYSNDWVYHRMWSDGRMEVRSVPFSTVQLPGCNRYIHQIAACTQQNWQEVPPPPGGNGFACRTDLNGDRSVDGVDLGIMLGAWGPSAVCNPDATYACVGFAGGIAP
jgi:hypothetical protein